MTKPLRVDSVIYLDCDPSVCLARAHERNRQSESGLDLDYLSRLERAYFVAVMTHMMKRTAHIIPVPWNKFGTTRSVLDEVLKNREFTVSGEPKTVYLDGSRTERRAAMVALAESGTCEVE